MKVHTLRRWRAEEEVDQAISRLRHKEVVERVQVSQVGLGWGEPVQLWSKATKEQRKVVGCRGHPVGTGALSRQDSVPK